MSDEMMHPDDDLAQHRTGPDAPVAPRAIGAESIPMLLEKLSEALAEAVRHEQARTWAETQVQSLRLEVATTRHHNAELSADLAEARADAAEGRRLLRALVEAGWQETTAGLRSAALAWVGKP